LRQHRLKLPAPQPPDEVAKGGLPLVALLQVVDGEGVFA